MATAAVWSSCAMSLHSRRFGQSRFLNHPRTYRYRACSTGMDAQEETCIELKDLFYIGMLPEQIEYSDFQMLLESATQNLNIPGDIKHITEAFKKDPVNLHFYRTMTEFEYPFVNENQIVNPYSLNELRVSVFEAKRTFEYLSACSQIQEFLAIDKRAKQLFLDNEIEQKLKFDDSRLRLAKEYQELASKIVLYLVNMMSAGLVFTTLEKISENKPFEKTISDYWEWYAVNCQEAVKGKNLDAGGNKSAPTTITLEIQKELINNIDLALEDQDLYFLRFDAEMYDGEEEEDQTKMLHKFVFQYEVWRKMSNVLFSNRIFLKTERVMYYSKGRRCNKKKASEFSDANCEETIADADLFAKEANQMGQMMSYYVNAQLVSNWNCNIKPLMEKSGSQKKFIGMQLYIRNEVTKKLESNIDNLLKNLNFGDRSLEIENAFEWYLHVARMEGDSTGWKFRKLRRYAVKSQVISKMLRDKLDFWFDSEFAAPP